MPQTLLNVTLSPAASRVEPLSNDRSVQVEGWLSLLPLRCMSRCSCTPRLLCAIRRVEHVIVVLLGRDPCSHRRRMCCKPPLPLRRVSHVSQVGLGRLRRQPWIRFLAHHHRRTSRGAWAATGGGETEPVIRASATRIKIEGKRPQLFVDLNTCRFASYFALIVTLTMSRPHFCCQHSPCVENHGVSCSHHTVLVKVPREM